MILPEKDSDPGSAPLARRLAEQLGIESIEQDLTPALEALGTYRHRDAVVERLLGSAAVAGKWKLVAPQDLLDRDRLSYYLLEAELLSGERRSARLNRDDLLAIVAATNMKQRMRMIHLYHEAERRNRLVAGTTNKTEFLTGFYVKYGDAGVDIEPLSNLWKTQVYQLARHLGLSSEIIERPPTPDTYSGGASDQEFFFCLPYEQLDLLLYVWKAGISVETAGEVMGLTGDQVQRAYHDFEIKNEAAQRLAQTPPFGPEPTLVSQMTSKAE